MLQTIFRAATSLLLEETCWPFGFLLLFVICLRNFFHLIGCHIVLWISNQPFLCLLLALVFLYFIPHLGFLSFIFSFFCFNHCSCRNRQLMDYAEEIEVKQQKNTGVYSYIPNIQGLNFKVGYYDKQHSQLSSGPFCYTFLSHKGSASVPKPRHSVKTPLLLSLPSLPISQCPLKNGKTHGQIWAKNYEGSAQLPCHLGGLNP